MAGSNFFSSLSFMMTVLMSVLAGGPISPAAFAWLLCGLPCAEATDSSSWRLKFSDRNCFKILAISIYCATKSINLNLPALVMAWSMATKGCVFMLIW